MGVFKDEFERYRQSFNASQSPPQKPPSLKSLVGMSQAPRKAPMTLSGRAVSQQSLAGIPQQAQQDKLANVRSDLQAQFSNPPSLGGGLMSANAATGSTGLASAGNAPAQLEPVKALGQNVFKRPMRQEDHQALDRAASTAMTGGQRQPSLMAQPTPQGLAVAGEQPSLMRGLAAAEIQRTIDPQGGTTRYDTPQGSATFQGLARGDGSGSTFSGARTNAEAAAQLADYKARGLSPQGNDLSVANRLNAQADQMRQDRLMNRLGNPEFNRASQREAILGLGLAREGEKQDFEKALGLASAAVDQQNADTNRMKAEREGGQFRPLAQASLDRLNDAAGHLSTITRLNESFKPDYFGKVFDTVGNAQNAFAKRGFGDESQANWFQDYQSFKNLVRNQLFGAALTKTERDEFEKANISPGMSAELAQKNLQRQQEIATQGAQRLARSMIANGADPRVVMEAFGDRGEELIYGPQQDRYGNSRAGAIEFNQSADRLRAGTFQIPDNQVAGVTERIRQLKEQGLSAEDAQEIIAKEYGYASAQ